MCVYYVLYYHYVINIIRVYYSNYVHDYCYYFYIYAFKKSECNIMFRSGSALVSFVHVNFLNNIIFAINFIGFKLFICHKKRKM